MTVNEHIKNCKCNPDIFPLNFRKELNVLGDIGIDGWWDWHIQEDWEYMSPNFWKTLGYDPKTKKNHPDEWQKILVSDYLTIVMDSFEKHVSTKGKHPFDQEVQYMCSDGSKKWIRYRGQVIEWDGEGQPVRMIGTHTDITESKNLHEQLSIQKQRMRSVYDCSTIGLAIVSSDMRFLDINNRFCEILGYTKEEMMEKTIMDITHEDDLAKDLALSRQVELKEIPFYRIDKRYYNKDGGIVWVSLGVSPIIDSDGNFSTFISDVTDITEIKEIQDVIEIERNKFKNVFDNMLVPMILFDGEGIIVEVNNAFIEEFQGKRDTFLGLSYKDITYFDDLQADSVIEEKLLKGDIKFARYEKRLLNAEGKPLWYLLGVNSIYHQNKLVGYVADLYNINEKKKKESKFFVQIKDIQTFIDKQKELN